MIVERKNFLKENNTGVLKIKNYTFERVENFRYLGAILNADNNSQTHLQERIKNANKTYFCMYSFGYFPGVRLWFADVSEPSISSIFKGWM